MFELADYLIGIYKTDNCTKSITIDPNSFAVPASSEFPLFLPFLSHLHSSHGELCTQI